MAKLLIDHGAGIDAKNKAGHTPLHEATLKGYDDIVELLRDRVSTSSSSNEV